VRQTGRTDHGSEQVTDEQVPDGAVPAAVIAAAVIAFVAYLSFQGSSHAVDYAVTTSGVSVAAADAPVVQAQWPRRAGPGQVLVLHVGWAAGEEIGPGSYAVLATVPPGWRHLGCVPECEWTNAEGVAEFARRLPRTPYRLAAAFEAEETGNVRVAFGSSPGGEEVTGDFVPTAWLVQTNGDDVLGAEQIPLSG
jgi:hypothetical protein